MPRTSSRDRVCLKPLRPAPKSGRTVASFGAWGDARQRAAPGTWSAVRIAGVDKRQESHRGEAPHDHFTNAPAPGIRAVCAVRHAVRRAAALRAGRRRGRRGDVEWRQYGLGSHLDGAGAVHDPAGSGAVLRRARAREECALDPHAVLCDRLRSDDRLGRRRLQPRVRRRRHAERLVRGLRQILSRRDRRRHAEGQHSRDRVRDVPDDLRDHHAGAGDRRLRRARALLRHAVVQRAVADLRLLPDRALGVGRWLAAEDGRDGFRRRHWSCT